ncbi:MAG: YajG family lipoprotein [Colwellia sp.]|nr:YajG family lipoprotein [Colwellia sp.]
MKFIKPAMAILTSLVLLGCADGPSHLIIAPEIHTPTTVKYHNKQVHFKVTDLRTATHIIQILREAEPAQLMTSQKSLSDVINQTLKNEFEKQGLILNQTGVNYIDIIIDTALIKVKQETMSYEAKSNISLRVKVKNNQQTLTKTFNSQNSSSGPLSADIAVLERDFNQQLTNALINILNNNEITQFIK